MISLLRFIIQARVLATSFSTFYETSFPDFVSGNMFYMFFASRMMSVLMRGFEYSVELFLLSFVVDQM